MNRRNNWGKGTVCTHYSADLCIPRDSIHVPQCKRSKNIANKTGIPDHITPNNKCTTLQ